MFFCDQNYQESYQNKSYFQPFYKLTIRWISSPYFSVLFLEPVCCKKQQKKFLTSYWFVEYGTSEDSEWYKIDSGWSGKSLGLIYNQFGIIQVLQRSPISQTSNWSGIFFAVSYSKPALSIFFKKDTICKSHINHCSKNCHNFGINSSEYFRNNSMLADPFGGFMGAPRPKN